MQTEDAGVKSSHPHFKFKKGNDMNDTVTKGNAAALLPIGVFLLIFLGAGIAFGDFYAMPAVVAFLIALFVAFMQNRQQKFACLLYTSPSPRDGLLSRMPSSA